MVTYKNVRTMKINQSGEIWARTFNFIFKVPLPKSTSSFNMLHLNGLAKTQTFKFSLIIPYFGTCAISVTLAIQMQTTAHGKLNNINCNKGNQLLPFLVLWTLNQFLEWLWEWGVWVMVCL